MNGLLWPIPASRLWPKKVENFTFEWLQLLVQTCYQKIFWLIIVHPVRVKTYRSLKIKFFVKVKNKVHVTIGHVCDFARNYGPAQNDFKVKILWCVLEFCIEQYTDEGQHIYKQFHILRMKFYRRDFFWCNITINDNDMLSYSLTTMVCFLTKEWYGFPAYTVKLFIKAYRNITYKKDSKIT